MERATVATGTYIYRYDHQGQRVIKDSNGQVRLYVYDEFGQLLAETDQAGNALVEYIYLNGQRLAMRIGAELYYVHSNHLDAPLAITDTSGNIVWQASYSPFGKLNVEINLLPESVTARFPGQYADAESGFYYNYFRDYDPEIGRYIQSDPIGLNGGINTYGYVGGNPINYVDPTGEVAVWGAAASIFTGYLISKAQGCDYSMSDALKDGLLGFVGGGLVSKANKLYRINKARSLAKQRGLVRNPKSSSYVEEYVGPGSNKSREVIAIKYSPAKRATGKHSQYPRAEWRTGKNQWKNPYNGKVGGPDDFATSHPRLEPPWVSPAAGAAIGGASNACGCSN